MSRLPRLERADLAPDGQAVWDAIAGQKGRLRGPFHALVRFPALAQAVWNAGDLVRFGNALSPAESKLAILATTRYCGNDHEWNVHASNALASGVRPEALAVLTDDGDVTALEPVERAIVEVARTLLERYSLDEASYDRAVAMFGEERLIELVAVVGVYALLSMLVGTFGVVTQ